MPMDLVSTFFMAALPVAKIFITCGLGAYLGHPSVKILTPDARKLLNRLVVVAFTPAFVFAKLAKSVSYENILRWWYMPFNILLCFIFGAAMGMLVLQYTSVPSHLRNLILACCAAGFSNRRWFSLLAIQVQFLGNTGNVPLVLIPSICEEDGSPFGRSEVCTQNAVAYVSYGMWTGIVLTWTFAYRLLLPPDFHKGGSKPAPASYPGSPVSSEFGDFQTGGYYGDEMEDFDPRSEKLITFTSSNKHLEFPSMATIPPPPSYQVPRNAGPNLSPRPLSPAAPDITQDPKAYFIFFVEKYDLKTVCNPPTCAAVLGLLVGGIPPLKSLFEGPFLIFVESADIIGEAMIPTMNMVLGASLVQGILTHSESNMTGKPGSFVGTGASELALPSIMGIIIVRLVALPVVGMIVTKIVSDLGMLPPDPLFRFVLMLQYTMPTAINVGTLSQLFSVGEKESALVLLYAYLAAAVFITFWIIIYLHYVFE